MEILKGFKKDADEKKYRWISVAVPPEYRVYFDAIKKRHNMSHCIRELVKRFCLEEFDEFESGE